MRDALATRIAALIDRLSGGASDDPARDALLSEVARFQRERVAPYARLWSARGELPAMPTDVFRYARVAAHPEREDVRVFLTSGTTSGARGRHALRDLALYDRAAEAAARYALFPDLPRMRLVMLAPHPDEAPSSSLSYMLGRFEEWFGSDTRWAWRDETLALDVLIEALRDAERAGEPIAILGTSFALVHAEDSLGEVRFALPAKSRLMQTGGYKGRSREVAPDALRAALSQRYGLDDAWIVAEYGMTELSSQMYEATLRAAALGEPIPERRLWIPGWVRASVVDPSTLAPLPEGSAGVLRLDDLANLDSVCAIQTSDLAIAHGDRIGAKRSDGMPTPAGDGDGGAGAGVGIPSRSGATRTIELLGRAPGATPRGCSLAVEEALGS